MVRFKKMGNPVKTTGLSTGGVEDIMSLTPELTELLNICIAERCTVLLASSTAIRASISEADCCLHPRCADAGATPIVVVQ